MTNSISTAGTASADRFTRPVPGQSQPQVHAHAHARRRGLKAPGTQHQTPPPSWEDLLGRR